MELLSLKWNNHKTTFFHVLSNLRKKEVHTDVTLSCDNKFYPAHKIVLSSCSDYFSEVFENTSCKSPVIILKDISSNNIECILDYMYLGEVDVKQSDLASLIQAAECLQIKGLAVPDEDPPCSKRNISSPDGSSPKRSRHESNSNSNINQAKQVHDANSSSRGLEESSSSLIAVETIKLENEESQEDTQSQYEEKSYPLTNLLESSCDNSDFDAHLTEFSEEKFDESLAGSANTQNENSWAGSEGHPETTLMQQPKIRENEDRSEFQEMINTKHETAYSISNNGKQFSCLHCDYKTSRRSVMNKHIRCHSEKRPFQCSHCEYAAKSRWNLTLHLRIHSREKPFHCSFCDYKATQRSHLKTHVFVVHRTQKN